MTGCYNGWLRLCANFHAFVGRQFARWSRFVYNHPLLVILVSLVVSFGLMAGFLKYNVYGQAERLFYPQNSGVYKALDRVEEHFDYYVQNEEFILKSKNKVDRNILTDQTFELASKMHEDLMKLDGFRDFCVLSVQSGCVVLSPLELFADGNFTDPARKLFLALVDNVTVMSNGLTARRNFPMFFGNFQTNRTAMSVSANVLRVTYPVRFPKIRKDYERNSKWELKMINYLKSMKKNASKQDLDVSFNTVRGISDSIAQNTRDNLRLIVVSIGSMVVFCVIAMVNWKSKVRGHILISLVGILAVTFGIGAGFGLALLMGQPYVGFIGVLPFLVLGIGIDDMFIIVGHLDRVDPKLQGADRLSEAMRNAGFSILMTTLTDLVAFVIGTVSVFPAVHIFCVFAFLSIFFAFLMINSLFLAMLSYDMKRIHTNRMDCLPCFKRAQEDVVEEKQKTCSYKIMKGYGFFLMKPVVKGLVLVVAAILLAFGVYGTMNTSLEFDYKISGASSSPYIDWLTTLETSFPFGVFQMDVVLDESNVNYADPKVQKEFQKLDLIATRVPQLDPTMTINWMSVYIQFCKQLNISSTEGFNQNLQTFLQQFKEFKTDLKLNSWNEITASRVHFFTKDKASWAFRKDALVNLREELETMDLPFYPVSFTFIYLSHLIVIVKATLSNVAICCVVVLFLTLTFVARPTASLLLLFSFLCFMLELLGIMCLWDLSLNSITMIVIVMAIGFAVDYNCHIVYGYLCSSKDTPDLRMIDSLTTMGACVLKSGLSTLIGVMVLSISSSKLFQLFFKMMFSIITLGLIHGMVILPVLLTLLICTSGPPPELDEFQRKGEGRESKKGLLQPSHQNGTDHVDDKITTL